jgi:hypothetical protein
MRAEIVKWIPSTAGREAYGFLKGAGVGDIFVRASVIISGKPFVGATVECKTYVAKNNRKRAYDVRVLSSGA